MHLSSYAITLRNGVLVWYRYWHNISRRLTHRPITITMKQSPVASVSAVVCCCTKATWPKSCVPALLSLDVDNNAKAKQRDADGSKGHRLLLIGLLTSHTCACFMRSSSFTWPAFDPRRPSVRFVPSLLRFPPSTDPSACLLTPVR